jgi:hypothetical protein
MKQRSRTNPRQTDLFCESEISGVPTPLPLAPNRETELKRAIAELLLNVALVDAEVPKGGERDK